MIYLDYSANTPVSEDVLRCFCETEREFFGNPNSTHDAGKAATDRQQRAGKKEVRRPSDRDCNREETEQSPEN